MPYLSSAIALEYSLLITSAVSKPKGVASGSTKLLNASCASTKVCCAVAYSCCAASKLVAAGVGPLAAEPFTIVLVPGAGLASMYSSTAEDVVVNSSCRLDVISSIFLS